MNSNLAFLFLEELGNTLIMTFASSALAYVIGIPLGILLVVWAKNGIRPNPRAQEALGVVINLIRSVAPFIARLVETSLREVDKGLIEAAQAMGATNLQIVMKVLLPEAMPGIVAGLTISLVSLVGYSAMAGFCGAGGLGAVAINYGYYRFEDGIMWIAILFLVILVQAIQSLGMTLVKKVDRRAR